MTPISSASRYTMPAIWPRVAPIARMIPICLRRCVTLMRNVLAIMNTATSSEKPRAIRMPWSVDIEVSSRHRAARRRRLYASRPSATVRNRTSDLVLVGIRIRLHLGRIDDAAVVPEFLRRATSGKYIGDACAARRDFVRRI